MGSSPYEYEALHDIHLDGVAAFRKGDPVPAAHLKKHGLAVGVDVKERGKADAEAAEKTAAKTSAKS